MSLQQRVKKLENRNGKGRVIIIAEDMTTEEAKRAGFPYLLGYDATIPPGAVVVGLCEREMKIL